MKLNSLCRIQNFEVQNEQKCNYKYIIYMYIYIYSYIHNIYIMWVLSTSTTRFRPLSLTSPLSNVNWVYPRGKAVWTCHWIPVLYFLRHMAPSSVYIGKPFAIMCEKKSYWSSCKYPSEFTVPLRNIGPVNLRPDMATQTLKLPVWLPLLCYFSRGYVPKISCYVCLHSCPNENKSHP
jgi:hypothetical protein